MIPCPHCGEELAKPPAGMGTGNPFHYTCWTCGFDQLVPEILRECAECSSPIVWCLESGEDYLCVICRNIARDAA